MAWLARPQVVRARGLPPSVSPGEVQPQARQRTASARLPMTTSSSWPIARHFTCWRTFRTVKERRAGAARDHSMMMRTFMALHGSAPAGPAGPWPSSNGDAAGVGPGGTRVASRLGPTRMLEEGIGRCRRGFSVAARSAQPCARGVDSATGAPRHRSVGGEVGDVRAARRCTTRRRPCPAQAVTAHRESALRSYPAAAAPTIGCAWATSARRTDAPVVA